MIFMNGETLTLSSYSYNSCLIMTKLAEIVENNGGSVRYSIKDGKIVNRSLVEKIKDLEDRKSRFERSAELLDGEKREFALEAAKRLDGEIFDLKCIKNDPVPITHSNYITFVLDGFAYYYEINDNFLFPFYYRKTPVRGNSYSRDAVCDESDKSWLYDCFFRYDCSKADITEAAYLIFNFLEAAPASEIRRGYHTVMVRNTYDDGVHREKVLVPERMEKIDF